MTKTQKQMLRDAERKSSERDKAFLEIMNSGNPLTKKDFEKLVKKNPQRWERYRGYFESTSMPDNSEGLNKGVKSMSKAKIIAQLVEAGHEDLAEALIEVEAKVQSKKNLFDFLATIHPKFKTAPMQGLKTNGIDNETYGRKSMIYITWDSPAERKEMEGKLEDAGFKVSRNFWKGSPVSEVQVSYFKGWHWDE